MRGVVREREGKGKGSKGKGKGKGSNLLLTAQRYDIVDCPTNCISSGAKHVREGSNKCQQLATKDLTPSPSPPDPRPQLVRYLNFPSSPRQGIPRHLSFPKTPGARAGHDPSVGSAEMSRICDRTYVVHHYLDQLPSQPLPQAIRLRRSGTSLIN